MTVTTRQNAHDRNGYRARRRPAPGQYIGRGVTIMPTRHRIDTYRAAVGVAA